MVGFFNGILLLARAARVKLSRQAFSYAVGVPESNLSKDRSLPLITQTPILLLPSFQAFFQIVML